ncbi:MAG: Abi family protein [Clostridia bacterium]|nr:Abi family protein [Clostridia bacterium]
MSLIVLRLVELIWERNLRKSAYIGGLFVFRRIFMPKDFKTYKEQLEILKEKGLVIHDESYAISKLKDISYFALINGYKQIFKKADGKYVDNASFEDIVKLFHFDEELRALMLKYILKIERKMKSFISYYFSAKYPNSLDYLDANNYQYKTVQNRETIHSLIHILNVTAKSNDYRYIEHYNVKHSGEIPLWVLVNALSFGKISKIYSVSQQSIQQKISDEFGDISNAELETMLSILALFRNACAHNERLFDFQVIRASLKDNKILNQLEVPKNGNNYSCGGNDFFSIVVCFKQLLTAKDFDQFFSQFQMLLDSLEFFTANITKSDILRHMHFPSNWESIKVIDLTVL